MTKVFLKSGITYLEEDKEERALNIALKAAENGDPAVISTSEYIMCMLAKNSKNPDNIILLTGVTGDIMFMPDDTGWIYAYEISRMEHEQRADILQIYRDFCEASWKAESRKYAQLRPEQQCIVIPEDFTVDDDFINEFCDCVNRCRARNSGN